MKKLIIGLVIGLTLGMTANAFASIGDTVSAVFSQFSYVVNGNAKAVDSPVLVYEGVSYVRTTDIGNMLGYDVTYMSDSRTITFNGVTPSETPTTSLSPTTTTLEPATVTETIYATPTPSPNANSAQKPQATQTAMPSPSPTPAVQPTAAPTNATACQAIRNNYGYQIAMVEYESGAEGPKRNKVLQLQYEEKNALAAASCN